jgi:hypothetical protein
VFSRLSCGEWVHHEGARYERLRRLEGRLMPAMLTIEVTETCVMRHTKGALRQSPPPVGVRIVIDDFGTGYSSLGYLHKSLSTRSRSTGRSCLPWPGPPKAAPRCTPRSGSATLSTSRRSLCLLLGAACSCSESEVTKGCVGSPTR